MRRLKRGFKQYQPPGIPEVDPDHRLAVGMTSCFVTLNEGVVIDALRPRPLAIATALLYGKRGIAMYNASAASAASTPDLNWTSGPFSVATWANVTGTENTFNIFKREDYTSESVNHGWGFQYRTTAAGSQGWNFLIENNNSRGPPGYGFADGGAFATGDIMLGGRSDGSASKQVFRNGVQTATSSTGNFVPASSSGAILYGSQNTSPTVTAYVYIACTWIRLLDASEFFEFYNDPYGVLIYQDDYAFASFAAVVSAPAFTAVNRRTLGPRVGSRSVY